MVDRYGKDFPDSEGAGGRLLLKLHGSLGWLHCSRCHRLYANVEELIAPAGDHVGARGLHRSCHCGAEMDRVIVTPTFVKHYGNLHLSNIWMRAQHALQEARRWVFVGYSLPDDDLWIRGMLLRAITVRKRKTKGLEVHVVTLGNSPELERRYLQLFPGDIRFHADGLEGLLEDIPWKSPAPA